MSNLLIRIIKLKRHEKIIRSYVIPNVWLIKWIICTEY